MLTRTELEDLLQGNHELRNFEVKGPGTSEDPSLVAKVARAAMGLANLRDGGYIAIGIDDAQLAAMLPGLDRAQLQSWLSFDTVSSRLAAYADPPVTFHLQAFELSNQREIVVIEVAEFDSVPHLCRRKFPRSEPTLILREGALYVRTRKVPATSEVADSSEMRELLDLATEKALRRYVSTALRAGIALQPGESIEPASTRQFDIQREEGWK